MTFLPENWQPTTYDNDTFNLDGYAFYVSAEYQRSFDYDPATGIFRFQVQDGDRFSSTRFTDVAGSERSEISMSQRQSISGEGTHFHATWQFMIEPGPENTASWLVMGQLHSGMNKSGPFEVGLRGDDQISFMVRNDSGEREVQLPTDITRGVWHTIEVDVDLGTGGHAVAWLDGQQVLNYSGQVGYSNQTTTHWNMGIYRNSPPGTGEAIAVNVKGLDMEWGNDGHNLTPGGVVEPPPPPPPPSTEGTTGDDVWVGGLGNDTFNGLDGNDRLSGKQGQDKLTGGPGVDTFVFDTTPSSGNADVITDFTPGEDKIAFDHNAYKSLWVLPAIGADTFVTGTKALDHNDHVIYDPTTGNIWYDRDGNGTASKVLVVTVTPGLALSNTDFYTY